MLSSRGSSQPSDETWSPAMQAGSLPLSNQWLLTKPDKTLLLELTQVPGQARSLDWVS